MLLLSISIRCGFWMMARNYGLETEFVTIQSLKKYSH